MNSMHVNDFILVKWKGKRKIKYLVAKVMGFELKDVFEVVYLKKCLDSNKFIQKDSELLYELQVEDVRLKLPAPSVFGGTQRLNKQINFPVSFWDTIYVKM